MSQFKRSSVLLGGMLALVYHGVVFGASNEHLRAGSAPPSEEKTWTPRFPDRSDMDTYCAVWGQKAIHGVGAYLLATPQERGRSLVITFQTSEEDKAHPEIFRTVEMDDGTHATVISVTDGYDGNSHWVYDEQSKTDVSGAILEGWAWAIDHLAEAEAHRGAPRDAWEHRMYNACKHEGAAK
jgi:hypothetical protein